MAYRGGVLGCSNPLPPKFVRPSKIMQKSIRLRKLLKIEEFRMSTPQNIRKKGCKILKLPPVRNCFTFATTNKLVAIINILKVPKIKKILQHEMKFLIPNCSCPRTPDNWGTAKKSRFTLSSNEFVEPPPSTKIRGYATDSIEMFIFYTQEVKLKVL